MVLPHFGVSEICFEKFLGIRFSQLAIEKPCVVSDDVGDQFPVWLGQRYIIKGVRKSASNIHYCSAVARSTLRAVNHQKKTIINGTMMSTPMGRIA